MIINKESIVYLFVNSSVAFLFSLFISTAVNAQQKPLKFSYLTIDNGLSHTDVKVIKQDKLGFIWIATLAGLDRYDGHTIKKFYNTNVPKRNAFKNRIISMCLDENDRVWIGSEDGIQLFDPKSEKYIDIDNVQHNTGNKTYSGIFTLKQNLLAVYVDNRPRLFTLRGKTLTDIALSYPKGVIFTGMVPDDVGNIWLSSNNGIWLLDHSFHFKHFDIPDNLRSSFHKIDNVFVNRLGQLLVTVGTTIALINEQSRDREPQGRASVLKITRIQHLPVPNSTAIMDIVQDKNLNYWVSTDAGLYLLDGHFDIRQIIKAGSVTTNLNSNGLDKLFIDHSECLWVNTRANGVNIADLNTKPFYTLQHSVDPNSLSGSYIGSILEESAEKVWIGTIGSGLNEYNLQTHKIKYYTTNSKPVKLKNDYINALVLDNDSNLWIGTGKGIQILNNKRDALRRPPGYENFPANPITSLAKDCYGNMWFGTSHNGFGSIVRNKKKNYRVKYYGNDLGHRIWTDSKKPELFVSTTDGLLKLIIDSTSNVIKTFHYNAGNKPNSLSSDYIFQVQKQNDSTYWIGTIGGGLDCFLLKKDNTAHVTTYDNRYGIFNDVETVELDHSGNIWMGGNGLERMNLNSKKLTRFDKNDGLQSNSFKTAASYSGQSGRLYFGGINGLNYFFPDSIKTNKIAARPVFTDLLINNKKVVIGDGRTGADENRMEKPISYSNTLHLSYLQNNFVISFSAMHYANPWKCQYRYKLVGFDKEWRLTDGNNPTASYGNLDYDDYSFVLEATNNDGVWSKDRAVMFITVAPPWWKSTIAKTLYLILFISTLVGIYIYQARWFRLKRALTIRHWEEKKQEELYHQQLKLNHQIQEKNNLLQEADEFKNKLISILAHDFRTPLSSTISIARMMRDNQGITEEEMELFYGDIEKDATKMLESFDTILQWIRQQLSGYQFKTETLTLHDLFRESATWFQQQLEERKITFSNQVPLLMTVISDKEMLQFINRNLLSNAIKFSPEGGTITVSCKEDGTAFIVTVADDGPGISEATLSKLFSISSQSRGSTQMGAGIALSMCRDFIKKLGGRIWAENKEPNGAILYYSIPSTVIIDETKY